jgi:hypothetical protein
MKNYSDAAACQYSVFMECEKDALNEHSDVVREQNKLSRGCYRQHDFISAALDVYNCVTLNKQAQTT